MYNFFDSLCNINCFFNLIITSKAYPNSSLGIC